MNLSRYFTLAEMSHSNTAVAERIPNLPGDAERLHLAALCTQVLDPLRDAVGASIRVNSAYRGPALNARIRGSSTSQHMKGQAADIQTAAVSVLDLFKLVIRLGLPFDQVIFEAKNASSKWVHVSHNPAGNRGEIRVAEFDASGRPVRYPQVTAEQAMALVDRVTRSSRPGQWPDYHETADEPVEEVQHGLQAAAPVSVMPAPAPAALPAALKPVKAVQASVKKPSVKKATAEPAPARKAAAKKAAAGKAPAKKAPAKKPAVTKRPAEKAAVKKAAVKKAPVKQAVASKAAVRPAAGRDVPAKKATAKKVATKKTAVTKAAAKKVPAKKVPAKQAPARKTAASKKVAVEKAAAKKVVVKKLAAKKVVVKKAAAKRQTAR